MAWVRRKLRKLLQSRSRCKSSTHGQLRRGTRRYCYEWSWFKLEDDDGGEVDVAAQSQAAEFRRRETLVARELRADLFVLCSRLDTVLAWDRIWRA
jgi:hypothetical protein